VYSHDVTIKTPRNKNEMLAWAEIIDLLRLMERDWKVSQALELACRRLAGVHTADQTGNWQVADVLEQRLENQSFVPAAFMQRALKTVLRQQAVHKSSRDSGASGGGAAGRDYSASASAHKGKGKSHKPSSGAGAGAASSHKKESKQSGSNKS
jgi:hypothetical protein